MKPLFARKSWPVPSASRRAYRAADGGVPRRPYFPVRDKPLLDRARRVCSVPANFDDEHLRAAWVASGWRGQSRHAFVEADAVMEMDDIIAVGDFGVEVERLLCAATQADQPFLLAQRAPRSGSDTKIFGIAEHDQLAGGPDEAAQQGTQEEGQRWILGRGLRSVEDFFQTLVFAFVVAKDGDFPAFGEPVAEVFEEEIAAIFLQDKVAARGMQEVVGEEGEGIGLDAGARASWCHLPPAPGSRWRNPSGNNRAGVGACRPLRRMAGIGPRGFSSAVLSVLDRALGIDIKFTQGDEFLVLPFGTEGTISIPREDIDDGAADAELATLTDLRFAGIARRFQLAGGMESRVEVGVFDQLKLLLLPGRYRCGQRLFHCAEPWPGPAPVKFCPEAGEDGEALGEHFGIRQRCFGVGRFHLGKEKPRCAPGPRSPATTCALTPCIAASVRFGARRDNPARTNAWAVAGKRPREIGS